MRPRRDEPPARQEQHLVGRLDVRDPVGDQHERGALAEALAQHRDAERIAVRIEPRRGFVEHDRRNVDAHQPDELDLLHLAARQARAAFADFAVEIDGPAVLVKREALEQPGRVVVGERRRVVTHVLPQRAVQQRDVLRHV
ncbi:hypothetical protein NM78_09975 [Burkholderia mallei]|nr:hypothetical protein NM78_09975 [Burkholderia mallei]ATD98847.1 hypothetical protein NW92_10385 [Burkholderia mallei]ATE42932.1 hypothetical protein NW99_10310 [Burkholderia mallei]